MAEQISKPWMISDKRSNTRRHLKQLAARQRRRREKQDPENAPTKVIRGWGD